MRKALTVATIAYAIIMIFCATLYFVQRSIVYGDHIDPNRGKQNQFLQVQIKDKNPRGIREAEIRFIDDHVFTDALRMGNELEEHLQILLIANLATAVFLVFIVLILDIKNKA